MFASRTGWRLSPNRLTKAIEERRGLGLPILDLTESNPTRCGFRYDTDKILSALATPAALTYDPCPRGPLAARLAVADYYAEREVKLHPEQIFLTTSTSEAYSFVFRLLADPGDSVLVPCPSYPLFDFLAGLNDLEVVRYPLGYDDGWRLDREGFDRCLSPRARAIIVVHPNNPTGSFVHDEELNFLLGYCERHSLALVADEVFSDYAFAPDTHRVTSLAGPAGRDRALTFILSGLSKVSGLPQMKLAWCVVNGISDAAKAAQERLEVIADTYLSVSTPLAAALPQLLETRRILQPQILKRVSDNLRWLDDQLGRGSAVSRLKAEGGWYAVLMIPSTRSDEDMAIELLEKAGVLVHPGHFYDFRSDGYLVVSLLPPPEVFQEGIRRILTHLAEGS